MPFVDWDTLLRRIKGKACTPFIGAGAAAGFLPLAKTLAEELAVEYGYPLGDCEDLARVTEFVAVTKRDGMIPKERIAERVQRATRPNFADPCEIHRLLADLDLPIYLTTNYDDFMFQALRLPKKIPKEKCAAGTASWSKSRRCLTADSNPARRTRWSFTFMATPTCTNPWWSQRMTTWISW
jgi:hypothetical protein